MQGDLGYWYGYWWSFLRGIHHRRILLGDVQSLFEGESKNRRWLTRHLRFCRILPSWGHRGWLPSFINAFPLILAVFMFLWESMLLALRFLRVLRLLPSIITSFSTLILHLQRDFFISSITSVLTLSLLTLFCAFLFFFFCYDAFFQGPCDRWL